MTQVAAGHGGLWVPPPPVLQWSFNSTSLNSSAIMDAAAEKFTMIGHILWNGEPGSAKTVSSAGGKIAVRTNIVTFANAGTTVRAGLQDHNAAVFPAEPDGTFDTYVDLVGGGGGIVGNVWNEFTLSTGSKSVAHRDLICVVLDMTARAGADSVAMAAMPVSAPGLPICRGFTASWQAAGADAPICVITADDGTLGYFEGGFFYSANGNSETWQDSTNPDERGNIFSLPWDCKINGLRLAIGLDAATDDLQYDVYSTPLGTPASIIGGPITFAPERTGISSATVKEVTLPFAPVSISKNVDYAWAIKATGTTAFTLAAYTLQAAAHGALQLGAPNKVARNAGAGAFTETTTTVMGGWIRVSSFDDGTGSGALVIPARRNILTRM